jgi:hypothetical protein
MEEDGADGGAAERVVELGREGGDRLTTIIDTVSLGNELEEE